MVFSGSTDDSFTIPGNLMAPSAGGPPGETSTWFFLYAGDPLPRSAVCLKNVRSLAPSDCAISFLEIAASPPFDCSALARGDRAALFSEATMDNGRLLPATEPRDDGRCCHDRVFERVGPTVVLGEAEEAIADLEGE